MYRWGRGGIIKGHYIRRNATSPSTQNYPPSRTTIWIYDGRGIFRPSSRFACLRELLRAQQTDEEEEEEEEEEEAAAAKKSKKA
ncbi:hypothetical protein E2C01_028600 [Portunus trituberculatus]|uniref:Uncharacterized protein n=1 Tax=Portunus trituberculatus TaxID=210409 RepID=A0A5B7ELY8_PORTR|nr:hypothetical protein [Portunus trituberculatus]